MYTDIPTATRCCFCAPMRYGLLVWAYIKLISSIITLGGLLLWMSVCIFMIFFGGDTVFLITLLIMTTLILLFDVVFNFVFVIGVHKRNTTLLRLYCRYGIAYVIALIIYFLLIAAYVLASTDSIFDDGHLWHSIGVVASAVGTTLILHSYLLVLIRSEIQKLKDKAQFKFENHAAEPKCFMQPITDVIETDKKVKT